jgi:Tol biopolymer transport system component
VFERDFARAADIFAINADGTGVRRVTHFRYSAAPFFSPDKLTVLFVHEDPITHVTGIWTTDADGTGDPQLVVSDSHRSTVLAFPQFSADGTKITFTRSTRRTVRDLHR